MSLKAFRFPRKPVRLAALCAAASAVVVLAAYSAEAQAPRLLAAPPAVGASQLSFADLVERVSPAVVSVLTERELRAPDLRGQVPEEFERFFRFGIPDGGDRDDFGGARRQNAQGSGFFVDGSGHIVTNNHVIDGADNVEVRLKGGKTVKATVVGADPLTDLAVLKIDPPAGQAFVQFAEDAPLRVGDWVVAVGNPYGLSGTVTAGIVSAIGGEGRDGQFLDYIQIDAPINRGNSGGPTFDLKGRVVGVNTAIYSETGGSVGIGFAIPSRVAKDTVAQLIRSGSVTRGFLGVSSLQNVTTDLAAALGRKDANGVLVGDVVAESPAAHAGIQPQDIVVAVNGAAVADVRELTRTVAALRPGSKANVKVVRDGSEKTFSVTLQERPNEDGSAIRRETPQGDDRLSSELGLRVSDLSQTARAQYRIPDGVSGVVVTGVKGDSPAENAGLQPGMVILQADGKAAASAATLRRLIEDAKKAGKEAVLLRYQIGETKQFAALSLKN